MSPCWTHFASILGTRERSWKRHPKEPPKFTFWDPLGTPSGLPFSIKSGPFFNVKFHRFFIDFLLDFGSILGGFWRPKFKKKRYQDEKGDFFENERLAYTRAQFWRVGGPKIRPKGVKNWIGKSAQFLIEKNIEN